MSKNILNEGYNNNTELFNSGKGSYIFIGSKAYIDLSMCAGSLLLGHNHNIFKNSIKKLGKKNISNLAAPNINAEKFSINIKRIVKNSHKIIFCNSGTEAIIKSLRISRAINKKKKIVLVSGGWHGSVDQLLFKSNKKLQPIDLSSGLKTEEKKNLIFIPYKDILKSKQILKKNKKKINSVVIEPIQGSLPNSDVNEYLQFLKLYCKKNNINLIFDEMITGLRSDLSTIQELYNIDADISIFGKCFGAGLPLGFISINKKTYKKINKLKNKIFFGGTFSGNSITSFIGNSVLNYIIKNDKKIFKKLDYISKFFELEMNKFFEKNNLDLKVYRFKSMLRLVYTKKNIKDRVGRDFLEMRKNFSISGFKRYIKNQGIYLPSSGIIFFSYAHSKKQVDYIIDKFKLGSLKFFGKN